MTSVVVRAAEVDGAVRDVVWRDGVVVGVHPAGRGSADPHASEIYADGGALIPAIHDHHIHMLALAAARRSVRVGPPDVITEDDFTVALSRACLASADGWVRAIGYHESVAGELDAARLDALVPLGRDTSIRVQHRSGQLWMFNRRAADAVDLESVTHPGVDRDDSGRVTGRVTGLDEVLRPRIPSSRPDLAGAAAQLARYGVTGVTDLTPTESTHEIELLADATTAPDFPLRVTVTGGLGLDPAAAIGLPRGPVKFLPADHSAIDLPVLVAGLVAAHAAGRSVAIHCVTRVGLVVAIAALQEAGVRRGDRIEHGAVIPDELVDDLADLGVVVVTQPNFVDERGDSYLRDVDHDDQPYLWRCGTLAAAGIGVAAGTDAPFGDPDPWRAIAAAIDRRTHDGAVLGATERIGPREALDLFMGTAREPARPRRVRAGTATDLCLLDRPTGDVLTAPSCQAVRATIGPAGLIVVR